MTIDLTTYQQQVKQTCTITDQDETAKLALIGMMGKLGEIAEAFFDTVWSGETFKRKELVKEFGNLLQYLTTFCNAFDINLKEYAYHCWNMPTGHSFSEDDIKRVVAVDIPMALGKMADSSSKIFWHRQHDLDRRRVLTGVSSLLWSLGALCTSQNISMEEVIAGNIARLQKRYLA